MNMCKKNKLQSHPTRVSPWVWVVRGGFWCALVLAMGGGEANAQSGSPPSCPQGASWDHAASACKCDAPDFYSMQILPSSGGSGPRVECRPKLPRDSGKPILDFYRGPKSDFYPICGAGRVPVVQQGSQIDAHAVASSGVPRWESTAGKNSAATSYAHAFFQNPSDTTPVYAYSGKISGKYFNRCACGATNYRSTPPLPRVDASSIPADKWESGRFLSENPTGGSGTLVVGNYGPLAISKIISSTGPSDGSAGDDYLEGRSQCGCPNFNEVMEPIVANATTDPLPSGYRCVPAVKGPPGSVQLFFPRGGAPGGGLSDASVKSVWSSSNPSSSQQIQSMISPYVVYIESAEFYGTSSQKGFLETNLMNRSSEIKALNGDWVKEIAIRSSNATTGATAAAPSRYVRGIWACSEKYSLNTSSGVCEHIESVHRPGPGDPQANPPVPASEVSPRLRISDAYQNTVNKGLAVCLNGFGAQGASGGSSKFDCFANDLTPYKNFNDLWSSTTSPQQGGLPFAIALRNAQGRSITGFYTLQGQHCDEFSEFAGDIQPGVINPVSNFGSNSGGGVGGNDSAANFLPQGSKISLPGQGPGGATQVYDDMKNKFSSAGYRVPTTPAEMRRCPILVRAAFVASCPDNSLYPPPEPQPSYETKDPSGKVIARQCTAASDIKIHLRVEQVWEIKGRPSLPAKDSITLSSGSSVSIQRILAEKYARCPEGMTREEVTGTCKWRK